MSSHQSPFVLEWSQRALVGYDARSNTTRTFSSAEEVAGATREAIVAVGRRSVFIRSVRVPDLGYDEIRQVLQLRLGDLFPVATQDLAIDFQLTDDLNAEGRLAIVAAMPTIELARLYADLRAASVRIIRVVPAAMASALIEGVDHQPSAVVQQTVDGLAIDIVAGGAIRQSRVTNLPQQIEAEICRTFGLTGLECGTIVSAGGLTLPFADLTVKESGLTALYQAQDKLSINLELPEEVAARRNRERSRKQRLALLLMAAAGVLGIYVFFDYNDSIAATRQVQTRHDRRMRALKTQQERLETALAATAAQEKELDRAYRPAQKFSDVYTILANRTNAGVWLTGVTLERGKAFSTRGVATSNEAIASYLKALSSEDRFRDVRLVFANNSTIEEVPVVNFSISGFPVGNLPLVETKKGAKR
ncbi:MAG TPA: PilN domain-containing protein [Fimbriimonas sp.]